MMLYCQHYSRATARARDLFCSRARATFFLRAKTGRSIEPVSAQDVFPAGRWRMPAEQSEPAYKFPKACRNRKHQKMKVALGSYCSMAKFYCYSMYFYCSLDKTFKGFNSVGRSLRKHGCDAGSVHRTYSSLSYGAERHYFYNY